MTGCTKSGCTSGAHCCLNCMPARAEVVGKVQQLSTENCQSHMHTHHFLSVPANTKSECTCRKKSATYKMTSAQSGRGCLLQLHTRVVHPDCGQQDDGRSLCQVRGQTGRRRLEFQTVETSCSYPKCLRRHTAQSKRLQLKVQMLNAAENSPEPTG